MTNQTEIPAEILKAAIQAINNERAIVGAGNMKSETFATLALEAAGVAALLKERDGLAKDKQTLTTALIQQSERIAALENERARVGLALFQNGYDNGYTTDGAVEAIELMAARIAELEKQLAQDQADLALLGAEQLGGSSLKLTMAIYDKWVKEQGDKMLRTRITELEAELAKHQESQLHPDWSALEATREGLREAWAKLKEMEQTAADARGREDAKKGSA